jgi:hypothetical protein
MVKTTKLLAENQLAIRILHYRIGLVGGWGGLVQDKVEDEDLIMGSTVRTIQEDGMIAGGSHHHMIGGIPFPKRRQLGLTIIHKRTEKWREDLL